MKKKDNEEDANNIICIDYLRPMSRLEFQILYGKCASSGWVNGEFNETLYQQYIQRYGFFLHHLIILKYKNFKDNDTLIKLNTNCDIFILVDKDKLIHTISLPGASAINNNNKNITSINWFFAESVNTLETYVYNPKHEDTPYYNGPNQIIKAKSSNWIENGIILLDFFPFPIIMSTDIRKDVVENGYTFRKHLSEYFKPLFNKVKQLLIKQKNTSQEVYLIAPPYTSVHAIFELEDHEWKKLITLKNGSNYKSDKNIMPFGFDKEITPIQILKSFQEIRKNEFNNYLENFGQENIKLIQPWPNLNDKIITEIKENDNHKEYMELCNLLKSKIYLNGSNVPGQKLK
jgi:hypothetical protein